MSWLADNLGVDLLSVFLWGAILGTSYVSLFWVIELLPLGDDRRATVTRLRPLVALAVSLVFGLFAAHTLFSRYETILPIALLLVLVAFFVGSRSLVRDFFAGVALRAEQSCEVGDHIRVAGAKGRVLELGPRAILLETPEGDRALVPYSRAAEEPIVRTRSVDQGASRTFRLEESSIISFAALCAIVKRTALLHHWGSISREPEITSHADGVIEVTVFALAQARAVEVENAIRKAIERANSA